MVHNINKLDKEEKENEKIQENKICMNLTITESGETRANLSKMITKYVAMLNQNKLCCLGKCNFMLF